MRLLARRVRYFNDEIANHDTPIKQLVNDTAPQLLTEPGVGHVTRDVVHRLATHPGGCHNEAVFARLGCVAPLPATSAVGGGRISDGRDGKRTGKTGHQRSLAVTNGHSKTNHDQERNALTRLGEH